VRSLGGHPLLAGDFNARTNTISDFHDIDGHIAHLPQVPQQVQKSTVTKMVQSRQSKDLGVLNTFGKELIDLCKDSELVILNGRTPGDEVGEVTCVKYNGCSVVDYFISAPSYLLDHALHLHVLAKRPESDHRPLILTLTLTPIETPPRQELTSTGTKQVLIIPRYNYHTENNEAYRTVISNLLSDTQQPIHRIETIQNVIAKAAESAHGMKSKSKSQKNNFPANPWYDDECKTARKT
jgi:hypothetical protein